MLNLTDLCGGTEQPDSYPEESQAQVKTAVYQLCFLPADWQFQGLTPLLLIRK